MGEATNAKIEVRTDPAGAITRGAGRAFSREVADAGAQSLWWNPAAIGGAKGCEAAIGASVILPRGAVTDRKITITEPIPPTGLTTLVGGDPSVGDPIVNGLLPSGSAACGLGRVALGVSLTSPFSFTTEYPDTSWVRYNAERSHLRTIDIQPSVAFEVADGLSIGAGLNIEQLNAELTNALPNISPQLPDGQQSLTGSGWDLGWSAGLRYARSPVELGASDGNRVPRVPDTNRWTFTVGASQALNPALRIDAALGYTALKDGPVYPYGPGVVSINTDGAFTGAHAVVLSLGGRVAF